MDRYDVLALVGLALLGVGLWMFKPALAFIVVGVIVMAVGVFGARGNSN